MLVDELLDKLESAVSLRSARLPRGVVLTLLLAGFADAALVRYSHPLRLNRT
jgi:hypothetical protein